MACGAGEASAAVGIYTVDIGVHGHLHEALACPGLERLADTVGVDEMDLDGGHESKGSGTGEVFAAFEIILVFRRFVSDDLMAFDLIEVPQEIGTETITEHPIGEQSVQSASQ